MQDKKTQDHVKREHLSETSWREAGYPRKQTINTLALGREFVLLIEQKQAVQLAFPFLLSSRKRCIGYRIPTLSIRPCRNQAGCLKGSFRRWCFIFTLS